ncbi:MAG: glycosyltransferase family 9 protein [Acidobacteriota bacterium]
MHRFLLLRFRLLGDVILTTPACRMLRAKYPDAQIDYVVEPPHREVVDGLPCLDRVHLYDRVQIKRSFTGIEGLRFVRRMRREHYDASIDFHGGPRSGLVTRAIASRVRVGYTGPHGRLFYNRRISRRVPGARIHSVLQQMRLLEPFGIGIPAMVPRLEMAPPPPAALERARALVESAGAAGFDGLASVHVPPASPFRCWGTEKIVRVASHVAARGLRPVLLGGRDSLDVGSTVIAALGGSADSLFGETTLSELHAVIAASRVFVGVDSGPMHVAATTATPIVAVFGPNVPEVSGPWTDRATIVEESLDCRPCNQRRCRHGDFRCFGRVDAARVVDAVDRWLADPPPPPSSGIPRDLYARGAPGVE